MEKRQKIDFEYETVSLFEAKIINKDTKEVAKTITSNKIQEIEISINVWIKCGKYELESLEKVSRQQVKIAV